jgi:hypothetical protein
MIEQHTLEITFEAEKVSELSDEHGCTTALYRTPEDTYLVYIDMRHIAEEDVARGIPRHAVLDDGHAGLGHSESFARTTGPSCLRPRRASRILVPLHGRGILRGVPALLVVVPSRFRG